MGQYYHPISIEKEQYVLSHDFENGLKIMEHSWIGNNFVNVVMNMISKGGKWFKTKIVWAGDYAEVEEGLDVNLYKKFYDNQMPKKDLAHEEQHKNQNRYLVNLTKKEYIDLKKTEKNKNKWGWSIHPLPLMTCEGNGQGGGDFFGGDPDGLVGSWSRCVVVAQKTKPRNCKEIIFNLVEN